MKLVEKSECYGCENCGNICPRGAISMEWDEEGFLYPVICKEKCTECGLCQKVCPAIPPMVKILSHDIACYGGNYKDLEKVKESSSGGAASALSEYMIDIGGTVYGAAYSSDFQQVVTSRASVKEEVAAFKGSKYVQSRKKDVFRAIENDLNNGIKVLYIGCPCEIAAIKKWLKSDKQNFYTAELICTGVLSSFYLRDFIAEVKREYGNAEIKAFTMRDTRDGWTGNYMMNIRFDKEEVTIPFFTSSLGRAWGIAERPSCYNCLYKGDNRVADITLGDFWGIHPESQHYCKWGNSVLVAHTEKGKKLITSLKGFCLYDVDCETAYKSNKMMTQCCQGDEQARKRFMREYKRKGLKAAIYASQPGKVRIKTALKKIIPAALLPGILKVWHKVID